MSNIERTLSIIKPDAVERNLDNQIKKMFQDKGFKIINEKKIQIEKHEAEKFYKVHETKSFYNDLCAYLASGPIVVMILERENAIKANRDLTGATNPKEADEGTWRHRTQKPRYGSGCGMCGAPLPLGDACEGALASGTGEA